MFIGAGALALIAFLLIWLVAGSLFWAIIVAVAILVIGGGIHLGGGGGGPRGRTL